MSLGSSVLPYEILMLLGAGGMGEVADDIKRGNDERDGICRRNGRDLIPLIAPPVQAR